LGSAAGGAIATGHDNIDIGIVGNAADSGTIRIGGGSHTATFIAGIKGVNEGNPTAVFTNTTTGQLGTTPPDSSRRYKKEIKPMDQISKAIFAFKPVTFLYKSDDKGARQFGLIAEDVAEVNPDLVIRDEKGEIYSVRYDAVNAMLLNEFLKEHRKNEEQGAAIAQLIATDTRQQKQIEALTAALQKVSAQIEMSKPAPQTVLNDQ
jgi:Chaperone of endosialidase